MENKQKKMSQNRMPIAQQTSEYLEQHQIYPLFQSLMSSLAIKRPSDPIEFLIQTLTSEDPCKIAVISNNPSLSEKCSKILSAHFKAKLHSISKENDIESQYKVLQSETNFVLTNYPQNKKQALQLLDARIIPDRLFIISNFKAEQIDQDEGDNDLIGLSNVFKHNTRFIHVDVNTNDEELKELLLKSYYEQRTSLHNHLSPKFPPRVVILGPPNTNKTKLALYFKHKLGLNYLNASHIMQQHINMHSKLGIEAEKIMKQYQEKDEGNFFIQNELIAEMIANDIGNDRDILKYGYILDNFPRNADQANALIKYGVKPNRIIILTTNKTAIKNVDKDNQEFKSDNIETPGIVYDDKDNSEITFDKLYDGFSSNIDNIINILCNKEVTGCGSTEYDTSKYEWGKIVELAYDFIVQPLPKH